MTSIDTYYTVKRRYFANLGIQPPSPPSPPSFLSRSPSPPLLPSCQPAPEPDPVSIDSFEVPIEDIFHFDDEEASSSVPIAIPGGEPSVLEEEDDEEAFVPPHLLSSYSGSSFRDFQYDRKRRAAKFAF